MFNRTTQLATLATISAVFSGLSFSAERDCMDDASQRALRGAASTNRAHAVEMPGGRESNVLANVNGFFDARQLPSNEHSAEVKCFVKVSTVNPGNGLYEVVWMTYTLGFGPDGKPRTETHVLSANERNDFPPVDQQ
ncbi:hypothetical protein [Pseudomonas amygdali]|uniref:Uncharacterized protein n=1 Tax=Pseudomonas amygdali pv. lachrymans str. M301315 TaxID=629260 RepID=A0AAD0PW79_PSEAV|nr:hypothetical protein [Pseudomonas amygdali]AXH59880.1 hypothetical protein PLA107_032155 [Pseudomonas amygdali pv. lachrymans str. M301315]